MRPSGLPYRVFCLDEFDPVTKCGPSGEVSEPLGSERCPSALLLILCWPELGGSLSGRPLIVDPLPRNVN